MAKNEVLDRVLNIVSLTKFKQELNDMIDKYMDDLQNDRCTQNDNTSRILRQIIPYYERTKMIYSCTKEDDDEDDNEELDFGDGDDGDDDNEENSEEYENIMQNRVFRNENSISHDARQENMIRRKILGLNDLDGVFEDNITDDNSDGETVLSPGPTDSSVDPVIYDLALDKNNVPDNKEPVADASSESNDEAEDIPNKFIERNIKHKYKENILESDIIVDDSDINYDEPDTKLLK